MNRIWGMLAPLALLALPVAAEEAPPGCAWLCGKWALDVTRSDSAESAVDAALEKYKDPEPAGPARPRRGDPLPKSVGAVVGPGPVQPDARPAKSELRSQLLGWLTPTASLELAEKGSEILIRQAGQNERRVFPGEPHSRVNADGITKVTTEWKKDALIVIESQGRGRESTETYALLPDGTLQVTLVLEHPGVKAMRVRAFYRRG